jgi:hypothetical protein
MADLSTVPMLLRSWAKSKSLQRVTFLEDADPIFDADDDYRLSFVGKFLPDTLDMMYFEVWLTIEGDVGVLLENRVRIAEKIGVNNLQYSLGAGFEPGKYRYEPLVSLLNLVSRGDVCFVVGKFPLIGLGSTRAYLSCNVLPAELQSFGPRNWLRCLGERKSNPFEEIVRYIPWS